jgi:hypothetical protein
MAKLGILKGFVNGTVWAGEGSSRIMLPFQDTVVQAEMTYTGELVMTETFSGQGILGASGACLQKEAVGFTLSSDDLSWSLLQAATLSEAVEREEPVLVTETVTLVDVVATESTLTTQYTPVVTPAKLVAVGLPSNGISVAGIDGEQYVATISGSLVTLDDDYTGKTVTIQYLRAPITGEEVIYLGSGARRQNVGIYGKFFGCPGSILVVAPYCAVKPNLSLGVSSGSIASVGLELMALRRNGYFAEITRLKDCVGC